MPKPLRTFDFELLPSFEYQGLIISLGGQLEEAFQNLPEFQETYDRARAALMFFYQVDEKSDAWRNEARLRAGLNELYSMQDSAIRTFKQSNCTKSAPKLSESRNPLVHLMYVLRHINVHTTPLPSVVDQITVIFQPKTTAEEMTYGAVMLTEVTIQDLLRSSEIKDYYDKHDLERSCQWLMQVQRVFGVAEVFSKGVSAYCIEILSKYSEQMASKT